MYDNKLWFFVKNLIGFLANLVTAAPKESEIPAGVLMKFVSSNSLIEFVTKLSEPDEQEESKDEDVA